MLCHICSIDVIRNPIHMLFILYVCMLLCYYCTQCGGWISHLWTLSWSPAGIIYIQTHLVVNSKLNFPRSDDSKIHIWPVGGRKPELTLLGHQNDVKCVQWHPDRSLLVSGSRDTSLRLWDPRSGNIVSTIHGHKKQVCMAVSCGR